MENYWTSSSYGIRRHYFRLYLHKKIGIEYYEFYEKLFEEVFADEEFSMWETELKQELKKWYDTGFAMLAVDDTQVYSWQLHTTWVCLHIITQV